MCTTIHNHMLDGLLQKKIKELGLVLQPLCSMWQGEKHTNYHINININCVTRSIQVGLIFPAKKNKNKRGCKSRLSPVKLSSWLIPKQRAINKTLHFHPTYRCMQPAGSVCICHTQQPKIKIWSIKTSMGRVRLSI